MTLLRNPPRGFRLSRCPHCALPVALCVCGDYPDLATSSRLNLVLPRTETRSTTNTARLLQLWLPQCTTIEVIGEHATAPSPAPTSEPLPPTAMLLFPTPGAVALDANPSVPPREHAITTLVVPDGTWSQARRLARRCQISSPLTPCSLNQAWTSCYTLRRRSRGLCTFEAVAISLGLAGQENLAIELLNRFHHWHHKAALLRTGLPPERCDQLPLHSHPAVAELQVRRAAPRG